MLQQKLEKQRWMEQERKVDIKIKSSQGLFKKGDFFLRIKWKQKYWSDWIANWMMMSFF